MSDKSQLLSQLKKELLELTHMGSSLAILEWDRQVNMPPGGSSARAQTLAYLAGLWHRKLTSPELFELAGDLMIEMNQGRLTSKEACIVRETWRDLEKARKLPVDFVEELVKTTSEANDVWAEAKKTSDFKKFQPYLEKIVELKRKEASFLGFTRSPYDALLDGYESGMTSDDISIVFQELKDFLIPFIQKIGNSKAQINPEVIKGNFPIHEQEKFTKLVAERIGYDFRTGRLDISSHPFSTSFHPTDARITTRYDEHDLFYSLGSVIHEAGHAMYEQGLLAEHFGTPLAESRSLGIHESQSRVWENLIGKSRPFWKYFYPQLQKAFPKPFLKLSFEDFYQAINYVTPSFVRTEADEVTYNLHVILRFEIEKELIEGSIEVADLPQIWNGKIKEYFGLEVPNDRLGVLQDTHWSDGSFGYFPTYTLGNLYSAQYYDAAKRNIPKLEKELARGEFKLFRDWLRKHIHVHGKLYSADELVRKATGEPLTSKYWTDYIKKKYSEIYAL
ncbi:MAG: carboxypeptidase M32 [bacterium]|nr:carboxypeptidase M32 [bacterium]